MTGMEHNLLIRNVLLTYLPITILVSLASTVATFINTFITGVWLSDEDMVVRKDDGLNVIVRDDSQSGTAVPEGVTHSNLLGLNTYYINVKSE